MKYLHCQIRVGDFEKWSSVMQADAIAQEEAGLRLMKLWRSIEVARHAFIPGQAFFAMEVQDVERARTYLTSLAIKWAQKKATVFQYEYHFVEELEVPSAVSAA